MMSLLWGGVAKILRMCPGYRLKGGIVYRSLLRRVKFGSTSIDVKTVDGCLITVDPNDFVGRMIYFTGALDRHVSDVLVAYAKEGDCLWDIGANIGYVSAAFAHRVPQSRVVAVEPQASVRVLLQRNLVSVAPDRHVIVGAAISDRCGEGAIDASADRSGMGCLSDRGAERVRVLAGEELIRVAGEKRCDLVKIDVEGHELEVIRGLGAVLSCAKPRIIVFECYSEALLEKIVTSLGDYRVQRIGRSLWRWHLLTESWSPWWVKPTADYVAIRR